MKTRNTLFAIITIVAFSLFTVTQMGCNKDDDNDPQTGTASFKVSMSSSSSARTTYDEINIDIVGVSIHTTTDSASTTGWFDLQTNLGVYDLLDYAAGNDTLIGFDSLLQVQTVSQIRLLLGDNNTIVVGGETYDLDTPSAQTSGLKIQVHAELLPEHTYKVVLDFDPDKSIKETGNNKYKLTPSIKATVIEQ